MTAKKYRFEFILFCFSPIVLFLFGCAQNDSPSSEGGSSTSACTLSETTSEESSYCSTVQSFSQSISLTSSAFYQARGNSSQGQDQILTAAPIRRAEVQVLNSSGAVIQCGETDNSGSISLNIPAVSTTYPAGTYTLKVTSRANNNYLKASVLNNPSTNQYYSITKEFQISSNTSSVTVSLPLATYTSSQIESGAFNIMDQLLKVNDYLRSNSSAGGIAVTVSPKINVYWTPGFNPNSYLCSPDSGVSFFKPDAISFPRGLYILGGINGDYNCSDTDHFDNSIIIHEYGHFLEDYYSTSDSPAGNHNGNAIIDPRLAWSEGWADFIQAAIRNSGDYIDSIGNSSCSSASGTMLAIQLDLNTKEIDIPTYTGEGVYREISIARTLWQTIKSSGANIDFSSVWRIFSGTDSSGLNNNSYHFRNFGMFNTLLHSYINSNTPSKISGYETVLNNEFQPWNQTYYGLPLTPQSSATCTFSFPKNAGGVVESNNQLYPYTSGTNLLRSNRFYTYFYDGNAAHSTINLIYSSSGTPFDLDLYAYKDDYVFADSSSIAAYSEHPYPESTGSEQVDLTGQSPGYYMIHIFANYNASATDTTFYLVTPSGERLCP